MKHFTIYIESLQLHSITVDANYVQAAEAEALSQFENSYYPVHNDDFKTEKSSYAVVTDMSQEVKFLSPEELELVMLSARVAELEAIISGSKQQSYASEEEQERDPVSRKRWTDKEMSYISQSVNSSHRKCHTLSWLVSKLGKNRTEDAIRRKLSSYDISINNDNLIKLPSCTL